MTLAKIQTFVTNVKGFLWPEMVTAKKPTATPILTLNDARIFHMQGFGAVASPDVRFRVELDDEARLSLYRQNLFGDEKALSVPLIMLDLGVGGKSVQAGGGFVGGGFGPVGAAEGMLTAAVLNALTTRYREYALLFAVGYPHDGPPVELVVGFDTISESHLTNCLVRAVLLCTECHVRDFLNVLKTQGMSDSVGRTAYAQLRRAAELNLFTRDQIRTMWSALAQVVPPEEFVLPVDGRNAKLVNDRVASLKALAELRDSGALTQEEFETEKARILLS